MGCQTVYNILDQNGLHGYYDAEEQPGVSQKNKGVRYFDFLADAEIQDQLLLYKRNGIAKINLRLPEIHCSSCIWLLEHLHQLHSGVVSCTVNFPAKSAFITFNYEVLSLQQLAELIHNIGYTPDFTFDTETGDTLIQRKTLLKIGVAGFCFGNIMLLAFPEYLGIDESFRQFQSLFGYISILLSLPVFFYSGWGFIQRGFRGVMQRTANIDIPVALGMVVLLLRSSYEIVFGVGAGYLDSLAGLVFFLLVGRWFQDKTYSNLSFNRDYTSYFPYAVFRWQGKQKQLAKLGDLQVGDSVEIRHEEIIPADGKVMADCHIDYSFVTGEQDPVSVKAHEKVFAGGRNVSGSTTVLLEKSVDASYLTQLWNKDGKSNSKENAQDALDQFSRYFTVGLLLVALAAAVYWAFYDVSRMWEVVCAVLIVACPCALALSVPFTHGSLLREFDKRGLFLKSPQVIERLKGITDMVFDKTGTLTQKHNTEVAYQGVPLSETEQRQIVALASNSSHPLSEAIVHQYAAVDAGEVVVEQFSEHRGLGVSAKVQGQELKLGASHFLHQEQKNAATAQVHVGIGQNYKGYFSISPSYRTDYQKVLQDMGGYALHVLSGDNDSEKQRLSTHFPSNRLHFNQSPFDKLAYIQDLQEQNKNVLMLGDGLNDAGALTHADVGFSISDGVGQFTPASDGILQGEAFQRLPKFLRLAKKSKYIVRLLIAISLAYNAVGIYLAINGFLSPLWAAILMPLSSVTVVFIAVWRVQTMCQIVLGSD